MSSSKLRAQRNAELQKAADAKAVAEAAGDEARLFKTRAFLALIHRDGGAPDDYAEIKESILGSRLDRPTSRLPKGSLFGSLGGDGGSRARGRMLRTSHGRLQGAGKKRPQGGLEMMPYPEAPPSWARPVRTVYDAREEFKRQVLRDGLEKTARAAFSPERTRSGTLTPATMELIEPSVGRPPSRGLGSTGTERRPGSSGGRGLLAPPMSPIGFAPPGALGMGTMRAQTAPAGARRRMV